MAYDSDRTHLRAGNLIGSFRPSCECTDGYSSLRSDLHRPFTLWVQFNQADECDVLYLACLVALVFGGSGPMAIDDYLRKKLQSFRTPNGRNVTEQSENNGILQPLSRNPRPFSWPRI